MAMNVAGKTAIVTGAGSGINLCFAKLLLEKGCNVVFADLTLRPEAQALVSQYTAENSSAKAIFQKTDVTDWEQLDKMFEVAISHFGGADIVCPGAGVFEPVRSIHPPRCCANIFVPQPWSSFWHPPGTPPSKDETSESRYALLDINVTHPIRVTQMAISHFLSQKKSGVIPHITSVAGQCPFFPTPVYVASKHAISGFVRSLARLEMPPEHLGLPKIRVNAVAPGRILTPLWTDNPDKMKMIADNPGWVTPEDVAVVMMGLVEKEEWVGGTVMEVGRTVREVKALNDPGPPGPGTGENVVVLGEGYDDEMWESLKRQFDGV